MHPISALEILHSNPNDQAHIFLKHVIIFKNKNKNKNKRTRACVINFNISKKYFVAFSSEFTILFKFRKNMKKICESTYHLSVVKVSRVSDFKKVKVCEQQDLT